jgi:hypothetical protein
MWNNRRMAVLISVAGGMRLIENLDEGGFLV